ncbi:hypothetical protein [Algoriphagus taiwanensis]|uniref:PepSY domain-containing protein n=1 Tax=Algoriphagus taiwanensis TaxID=1445656 RepID=A0ABQ6Q6V2_9BACT|nr:hypothetical protein Ataiwa_36730 [Algoriphagus taiwanensis]
MKKVIYLLLPLFILSSLISCNSDGDEDPLDVFREIAYNSLTVSEKSTLVDSDWRSAEVTAWVDGYYLVVFRTTEDATLGPIRVVVDPTRGVVIEKLTRP